MSLSDLLNDLVTKKEILEKSIHIVEDIFISFLNIIF